VIADPIAVAKDAATRWGQTVVLKYGYTVATDGTRALVADDAPVSLATAGSGDVFAGTIGAFLAQGLAPLDAAGLALFAGPRAARIVEQRTGTLGLVASDLPMAIAEVLADLEAKKGNRDA
ncbi:MAG TPA: NAD(P)H-hydrate dehydratase, partial [Thermomicrobiales bacterium]